jgi:hypothetical protein
LAIWKMTRNTITTIANNNQIFILFLIVGCQCVGC